MKCTYLMQEFLKLYKKVGVPISNEKTVWPTTRIVFLGILLDGQFMILVVPEDKRKKAVSLLTNLMGRSKATVKELQTLCGYLNFLNRAVYPGCIFLHRMYTKYQCYTVTSAKGSNTGFKFKQYHHVRLDSEFRTNCKVWLDFLTHHEISKVVNRPMIDIYEQTTACEISFYSDASANGKLGFGCVLNKNWLYGQWDHALMICNKPSIEYLELFAMTAGILTWEKERALNNCRIIVFCDNQAVVNVVNNITSSCKNCMVLFRLLVLNGIVHNCRLYVKYVKSKDNGVSDALSRLQFECF